MNSDKESLVFSGSSCYSCCTGWAVPAAWMESVNASCRTGQPSGADSEHHYYLLCLQLRKCLDSCLISCLRLCWHHGTQHSARPSTWKPCTRISSSATSQPNLSPDRHLCSPVVLDGLGSSVRRQGLWERLRAWKTRLHNFVQNRPRMPIWFWIL